MKLSETVRLVVAVTLCTVPAYAVPTIGENSSPVCVGEAAWAGVGGALGPILDAEAVGSCPEVIAEEVRAFVSYLPPDSRMYHSGAHLVPALPALPSAVWMVLAGFLPLTWVRDRKRWAMAVAGVLWLGQAGLGRLGRVEMRLGASASQSGGVTAAGLVDDSAWDPVGLDRRYAALLRRLAEGPAIGARGGALENSVDHQRPGRTVWPDVMGLPSARPEADDCAQAVAVVRQFEYFSAGCWFEHLARGPPGVRVSEGTFRCGGRPQRAWPFRHAEGG